jgi:hypothetical protein
MHRFLFLILAGCLPAAPPTTGTVTTERFHSALMNDDYLLRIRLPPGYDAAQRHPLVVQLDPTYVGLHEFDTTCGVLSQHPEWGEVVVVGIDYPDPYTRERDYRLPDPPLPDYSGEHADRFHRVLAEEILPYLDSKLSLDDSKRTLVGHSNGGVFAWYESFRASLWSGILAADCGLDENLFTYERWHHERTDSLPIRLYASRAVFNGASQQIVFRAMVDRVSRYADLSFAHEELETDHGGAILPSFEHGLSHIVGGAR